MWDYWRTTFPIKKRDIEVLCFVNCIP